MLTECPILANLLLPKLQLMITPSFGLSETHTQYFETIIIRQRERIDATVASTDPINGGTKYRKTITRQ